MIRSLLIILFLLTYNLGHSQVCDFSVPQIIVDLSGSPTGEFAIDGANLSGDCCGSENLPGNVNCIEFIIITHPNSFSFSFNLSGGLGNGNLYLNCDQLLPVNNQFCVYGEEQFSLVFCKPGQNPISGLVISSFGLPEYNFEDIMVEQGCVTSISSENFQITSVFPNGEGYYDYLLSCLNCNEVIIDTSLLTEYVEFIDFKITPDYLSYFGIFDFNCDGIINTGDLTILLSLIEENTNIVRVNIIPKVELSVISDCNDFVYSIDGGTEPYTFILNDEIVNEIIPVEGLNTLIVESSLCSSDTVIFEWYVSKPPIEIFYDDICLGDDAFFTTFSEETLHWNFGDGTEFIGTGNVSHIYNSSGDFIITVSYLDSNICDSSLQTTIKVYEPPSVNASVFPNEGCVPLNIELFSEFNSEYTYTWDLGFTTSNLNELLFTLNEPSNYTIEHIVSNENCNSDTLFFVSVYNSPISNFTIDPNIVNEDEIFMVNIENNSQFGDFYLWDFGLTTMTTFEPNIEELSPGEYNVSLTVTNNFGCSDISYGKLIIKPILTFYIPNAITPNGDGVNDFFYGEGIGVKKYEMSIYNRWGEKIFYTDSKEDRWNGGVTEWYVQNDVYLYVFKITDIMGKIHLIKGHVTVIR
jgi:gliding motility-associated-like protein